MCSYVYVHVCTLTCACEHAGARVFWQWSGLASRMRRLVVHLCVQGHWCERAVRAVLPPRERV